MKLNQKEREVISALRNITHENEERINNILLGLMTHAMLNYVDGEPITIPYFGTFLIRYKGDEYTTEGREAVLESFFSPSPYLKENIGCYEDFKNNPKTDLSNIPIIKLFETENKRILKDTLSESFYNDNE